MILHILSGYSALACADGYSTLACIDDPFDPCIFCWSILPLCVLAAVGPARAGMDAGIFLSAGALRGDSRVFPVSVHIFSLAFLGRTPDKIHPMRRPERFARLYII